MPPDPTPKARPATAAPHDMVISVSPQPVDDYRPSAAQRKWEAQQRAERERARQEREAQEQGRLRYGQRRAREAALLGGAAPGVAAGAAGEIAGWEGTAPVRALLQREAALVLDQDQGGAPGGSVVRADDPLSVGRAILDVAALVAHLTARVEALAERVAALTDPGEAVDGATEVDEVTYPTRKEQ